MLKMNRQKTTLILVTFFLVAGLISGLITQIAKDLRAKSLKETPYAGDFYATQGR